MATASLPRLLLRFDTEANKAQFERWFDRELDILSVNSDAQAVDALNQPSQHWAALVVLTTQARCLENSVLLERARDRHPATVKILIADNIPINLLASLLERRLVNRCFEQPVNPDLVRSHILAAALSLQSKTLPHHAPTPADLDQAPTILIVDDEVSATKYLARQLERLQNEFNVLCAESAEDALHCLRHQTRPIAAVMTDQRMPGMQGKELLDELRQSHPNTVRILTSAYGEVDVALGAVNDGQIFRYQKKPWQADAILDLFREAVAQHRALVATQTHQRSRLDERFGRLREQRRERLQQSLSEGIDPSIVSDYLQVLAQIETLPASPSHVRASEQTSLESDLVHQFTSRLRPLLEALVSQAPSRPETDETAFDINRVAPQLKPLQPVRPGEEQSALSTLCQSLSTLLRASGMDWHDVDIERDTEFGNGLRLTTRYPFRFYSHLLAPLTRVSGPLLDQQVALLLLFVCTRALGGDWQSKPGKQCCSVDLRLPVPTRGRP